MKSNLLYHKNFKQKFFFSYEVLEISRIENILTFFMTLACKDGCINLTGCLQALRYVQKVTNRTVGDIFKSQ